MFFYTYNMREVLGPPIKNSVCFYSRVANGYSGWLNHEDVLYLMHYILSYDSFSVKEWPNLQREGIEWYGLRLKATKEIKTNELRYLDGKKRMVPVTEYKDADTLYYFKDKELRDSVKEYWNKIDVSE